MSKPTMWFAWIALVAMLVCAPLGTAYADAGGPPTPTFPPPPTPTFTSPPPPTATPTIPYPPPVLSSEGGAEEPPFQEIQVGTPQQDTTTLMQTLEPDAAASTAAQEERGFPLWPVILVLVLGLALAAGIVGYYIFVRR